MSAPIAWLVDPWPGAEGGGDGHDAAGGKPLLPCRRPAAASGAPPPPPTAAAWLPSGRWGHPDQLALPLSDRGLLLADGLFETVLVEAGQPRLLSEHLSRWSASARLLAMAPPPTTARLRPAIAEAVERSGITDGALRLNWSRGSGGPHSRGLDLAAAGSPQPAHRFWLQLTPWRPLFSAVHVIVSPTERRCATSLLSRCKTFAYGAAIQARRQAHAAGADDALLPSTAGGLCCGTVANLLVRRQGRWLTPPLSSGCLPGVMRRRALELNLAAEAEMPIAAAWLGDGGVSAALLLNSLGCRPISHCAGVPLQPIGPAEAEGFWRSLL
ncbi:MAG: aminotransferase class IV [Synechococcus sp.]|nr:aminotransferase class IV [Synechococcus sp.]